MVDHLNLIFNYFLRRRQLTSSVREGTVSVREGTKFKQSTLVFDSRTMTTSVLNVDKQIK